MALNIPTNAYFIPVNLSSSFKTFTLPVVSSNPGRVIVFKDAFGNALTSSIRFSTVGLDRIERSTTSTLALSNTFGAWTFINDGITTWSITEAYLNSLFILPAFTPLPPRTWSTYARSDGTASVTSAGATFTATIVGPNNGGGFGYAYVFSFFTTSGTLSLIFNYSSSDGQPYDWGFYNVTTANPAGGNATNTPRFTTVNVTGASLSIPYTANNWVVIGVYSSDSVAGAGNLTVFGLPNT